MTKPNDGINVLPDGSAFFVGTVRDKSFAYPIVLWRNMHSAHTYCNVEGSKQWSWFRSFRWAFSVTPFYLGGYWR